MNLWQTELTLSMAERGLTLITDEIVKAVEPLKHVRQGLLNVFLKHTSASLIINENADPSVRKDLETFINKLIPEDFPYTHDEEGPDDMPAHVKTALFSPILTIPVSKGRLSLGTWQGIYLWEHRNHGGNRKLVLTLTYV
jgi:secondary thiamine-phosphate synthase enzyme